MKIILYVRKPKLQKPDDLYEGMPVYQCWPRSANMDNSNAESWASGRSWQTHYECVKVEVENRFDIILAGGVSFRGQSAKVPIGLIWNGELQAYLSFDFRVDYLMAALDVCDVRERVIGRKMSFIYKGSNYYPVPYGSDEYLVYEKAQDAKAKGIRPKYTKSYSVGDVILSQGENLIYLGEVSVVDVIHRKRENIFGVVAGRTSIPHTQITQKTKMHFYLHESGYIYSCSSKKSTTLISKPSVEQEKTYKQIMSSPLISNRSAKITGDGEYTEKSIYETYISFKDKIALEVPNYVGSSVRSSTPTNCGEKVVDLLIDQRGYIRNIYECIDLKDGILTFSGGALVKPLTVDTRNIK